MKTDHRRDGHEADRAEGKVEVENPAPGRVLDDQTAYEGTRDRAHSP